MAPQIDDVKRFLYEYYRQRHFDLMPVEVRARYDDYAKNKDFNGNMKWWDKELNGRGTPELTDDKKRKELFEILHAALQSMFAAKKKYEHNAPVKNFIEKWFGTFRPFAPDKTVNSTVDEAFEEVKKLLERPTTRSQFERIFKHFGLLTDDFFFYDLLDGIGKKKYNTDVAWRKNALGIVDYIMQYGPDSTATPGIYGPDYWPRSAVLSSPTVFEDLKVRGLPENKDDWFQATYDDDRFKSVYPRVLDELLRSELVRTEFAKHERTGKVVGQLDAAIKDTDYENPDSKDYVPPKPNDEKNIFQTIKKWKEDTYENYLRRFTEPGRGTRLYFSPFAHTIIKAIDKEKIKPTDGIAGILDKKDKIMGRISAASPTAKKHFEWITKTLGKIKGQIPNAFGDALKGGAQLQDVVSQIIIAAVKENKVEEAKTAMEILAVCKYGITTSKTMDAIANTDLTILSDKDLSWNKNEGMRVVTKAMDKTIKYSIVAAGRTLAAARNAVRHANTKFNGDISKNNDLNKAYKAWVADDKARYDSEKAINDSHNVTGELATLAAGGGLSGHRIDATTLDTAKADLKAIGEGNPGYDELKEDIDKYIAFSERRDLVEDWRGKNKDRYQELVAYWDLMASTLKTHSFQLGMISVREQFMKNRAQNVIDKNLANYGGLQYAA